MRPYEFNILPVPEILKNDVECFRTVKYTGDEGLATNVPVSGLPGIVFQHNKGRSPIKNITTPTRCHSSIPTLYVYGQITEPSVMNHKKEPYTLTQVILKPHALQTVLGLNASALTDGAMELNEISATDLNSQLFEANDEQEHVALLTDFLLAKLKQVKRRDELIEESLRLIHSKIDSVNVKYLLEQLNISERQFERRFNQTVGVSPKFYIRVKRFNQAVMLMKTGQSEKFTDIAHALNFYDEPHFIRDIKAFSGITPKSLALKEDSFHPGQGGYSYG